MLRILVLAVLILLAGCGTSPPIERYVSKIEFRSQHSGRYFCGYLAEARTGGKWYDGTQTMGMYEGGCPSMSEVQPQYKVHPQ